MIRENDDGQFIMDESRIGIVKDRYHIELLYLRNRSRRIIIRLHMVNFVVQTVISAFLYRIFLMNKSKSTIESIILCKYEQEDTLDIILSNLFIMPILYTFISSFYFLLIVQKQKNVMKELNLQLSVYIYYIILEMLFILQSIMLNINSKFDDLNVVLIIYSTVELTFLIRDYNEVRHDSVNLSLKFENMSDEALRNFLRPYYQIYMFVSFILLSVFTGFYSALLSILSSLLALIVLVFRIIYDN